MANRPRTTGAASHGSNSTRRATASTTTMAEPPETYEERQRRYNAARVLESNEMLIWWSTVRNESLPQTRLHFENQLAGFTSDDSDAEWDDAPTGGPPAAGTPGVAVRFLLGENTRAAESPSAAARERAYNAATAGGEAGGVPDVVPLGGRGRRSASGGASGSSASGENSPAGQGAAAGKKGRRSLGGGGSGGGEAASA